MPTLSEMIVSGERETLLSNPREEQGLMASDLPEQAPPPFRPGQVPMGNADRADPPAVDPQPRQGLSQRILEGEDSSADQLGLSLDRGSRQTPERAGRVLKVQERTRLPIDLVERNLEELETRIKRADFDIESFRRNSPLVTDWISENPQHAALVQDDVEDVGVMENLVRGVGDSVQRIEGGLRRSLFTLTDPLADALERTIPLGRIAMEDGRLIWRRSTEEDLESPVGGAEEFVNAPEELSFGYEPGTSWEDVKDRPLTEFMPFAIEQGIVSVPDMVVAALSPATFTTSMTGQIGQARAESDQREVATVGDLVASLPTAAAMSVMERLGARGIVGLDETVKGLREVPGAAGRAIQREGATEFVQEGLQSTTETAFTEQGFDAFQTLDQALAGAVGGAGFGGTIRGITATAEATIRANNARRVQQTLDALADPERARALRENSPEKYRELVGRLTRDTPMESVYLDAGRFNEYFQEQGQDPRAVAESLFGEEIGRYDEALRTGGQLEIPVNRFAAADLDVEAKQFMAVEGSINPNEMSVREWDYFIEALNEQDPAQVDPSLDPEAESPASADLVYQDVFGQLLGIQPRDVAERNATLMTSVFRTMGQRAGVDPMELYQKYGLKIEREVPDLLREQDTIDNMDAVLDRLRAGDIPRDQDIFGESLVETLRRVGINDEGGELAAMDIDADLRPFQRRIIRDDGETLDGAAEVAAQAGYIQNRDIGELLSAIDAEMRGEPQFVPGREDSALRNTRESLEQLADYLDQIGIDLRTMDNEAVKAILSGQMAPEQAPVAEPDPDRQTLDQDTNDNLQDLTGIDLQELTGEEYDYAIELFERLAADQATVSPAGSDGRTVAGTEPDPSWADETRIRNTAGRPALVYRGAARPLEPGHFEPDALGVNTGYAASGLGTFFTTSADEAAAYGNVEPFNLDLRNPKVFSIGTEDLPDFESIEKATEYREQLLAEGHDGIVIDLRDIGEGMHIVAFEPEQVIRPETELFQSAFHGTPHQFDRFSLEAVGTGEGAQMFGWGLYFAGNREVAEYYREVLSASGLDEEVSKRIRPSMIRDATASGDYSKILSLPDVIEDAYKSSPFDSTRAFSNRASFERGIDSIRDALNEDLVSDLSDIVAEIDSVLSDIEDITYDSVDGSGLTFRQKTKKVDELKRPLRDKLRELESQFDNRISKELKEKSPEGTVYEVNVPEDSDLIDWDKEFSQQRDEVKSSILNIFDELNEEFEEIAEMMDLAADIEVMTGEDIYRIIQVGLERDILPINGPGVQTALEQGRADQAASLFLHNEGIPGLRYLDQGSRAEGDGTYNYVIWDENAITIQSVNDQQRQAEELFQRRTDQKRGSISFGANRQFNITLFEKADLSTFLHESGHFYLEVLGDLAQAEDAPQQIRDDYQKILDWFGVESREDIGTEQHEQWARGFEAYLMEGKAPSQELAPVFARFWSWLVSIYRTLNSLNVDLTDEVRGVMDRMVATDEEIEAASGELGSEAVFTDPAQADMTPEQFADYQAAVERARDEAKVNLTNKLMAEKRREQKAWWREQRTEMRQTVADEINQERLYIALSVLQFGTMPDGSALPEGVSPVKLSKSALVDIFGEPFLKRLPRPYVYSREGGMHPDTAADIFGFRTGEELVLALANSRPRRQTIEAETDRRMKEVYGDILQDGTLPAEAMESLHNDARAELLIEEVRKLGSRTNRRNAPLALVKRQAQAIIDAKAVRDIKPILYQRAEAKASRAAFNAVAEGDFETAFQEKQKQILNHELWRAARDAVQETEKIARFMRRYNKTSVRSKLGLAGADYLEQVDGIMERFEFREIPLKRIDRRASLGEWIREKQEAGETLGEEFAIPDRLRDEALTVNYKSLPYLELRGLYDTVRQIQHFASLKNRLLADQAQRDKSEAREELIGSAEISLDQRRTPPLSAASLTRREKLSNLAQEFDASLIKMEQVVDWLDGGDINGPWHRFFFNGAADAQAAEQDYTKRITEQINDAVTNMPKSIRKRMYDTVQANIPQRMARRELMAIALNAGNEGNYQKLLKGHNWTREQVDSWLKQLTKEEWDFIQSIWDTLEGLWPDIAGLQKELTGLEPDKVAARTVETAYGTYRGGYYPIMYHPVASEQGELQLSANIGGMLEDGFTRATTPKGHTKTRIDGFARPFNLDVDSLPLHIAGVVKDLTHRKWIIDANWIVNDSRVRETIRNTLGDSYVKMMNDWVKQVVNDRNFSNLRSLGVWRQMMENLRFNFVVAAMGIKATTVVSQFAGIGPSIEVIGGKELDGRKYYTKAMGRVLREPRATWAFVRETSGEMRHRLNNKDRDIRDKMRALSGKDDLLSNIQQFALAGIGYADMMVTVPTWLGGYLKALDQGLDEDVAIRAGDRAVRLSQGAGGAKDLSAVASKDSDLMRVLTMFYTPFSALYSRFRDVGHDFGSIKDVPQAAIRLWWVWLIPAVVGELLVGRGPDEDDDESFAGWAAQVSLVYATLGVPVLRDVAGAVATEYGYSFSPLGQVGTSLARTASTAGDVATGDQDWAALAQSTFKSSGYLIGLPTGQLDITGSYMYDLYTGYEDPDSPAEFARNLLYRRED